MALGRTQGKLAAKLGATRESLNRALRRFDDRGLLEAAGDLVTLRDPAGLADYVADPIVDGPVAGGRVMFANRLPTP